MRDAGIGHIEHEEGEHCEGDSELKCYRELSKGSPQVSWVGEEKSHSIIRS